MSRCSVGEARIPGGLDRDTWYKALESSCRQLSAPCSTALLVRIETTKDEGVPPLITKLRESRRAPYPITWEEQDRLFPKLPTRLARMALFAVNTGLRESNVCGLQWIWEVVVPEIDRNVFVIPPEAFKSKRAHVVILNDVAWSIIEEQRGKDPIWVFPHRASRSAR